MADTAIARKEGLNVRLKATKSLLIINPRPMISSPKATIVQISSNQMNKSLPLPCTTENLE